MIDVAMATTSSPSIQLCNVNLYGSNLHSVLSRWRVPRKATLNKGGNCSTCNGKGAVECKGCKGTGKNKKNGNIFERWKCFDCQGFGLVSCPTCGKSGLTPEQRGER